MTIRIQVLSLCVLLLSLLSNLTNAQKPGATVGIADCKVSLMGQSVNIVSPYKGGCKDGLAEGQGSYSFQSGANPEITTVKGQFRKGKLNGHATSTTPNSVAEEDYRDNDLINWTKTWNRNGVKTVSEGRNGVFVALCSSDGKNEKKCTDADRRRLLGTH